MNFWIIAIALLTLSAVIISWPLIKGSSKERFLGLAVLVCMPLAGLLLYQLVGTPDALTMTNQKTATQNTANGATPAHAADAPSIEQLIAELQQTLDDNPNNPEGWLMLGRSLKSMQQYPGALNAIEKANQQLPGTPEIMIELAEARLFASGNPNMSGDILQLLEDAISIDPQQQKGLWLLGMAESQAGNYNTAIRYWTSLQDMLDPASGAALTVAQQLDTARAQTSAEGASAEGASTDRDVTDHRPQSPTTTAHAIAIDLALGDSLPSPPANSVLFVFVHPAGQRGMPLAVKRISAPGFPLAISLSDADTLRPGTSLSDHQKLDISARVSMSGVANAATGDYQANTATVDSNTVATIVLTFKQRVP